MSDDHHHQKVTSDHLGRVAYLYVRQSTIRQVFENSESTRRQYALRQRAVALGWPIEDVVVIDDDLGQSGASATDREGFQKLVSEVSLGRVGIVLGLEVSRLARNCSDWHRLLEICALTNTLILDEDGLYNPRHFNDRLVLGLKGTMSEAELHLLKARLRGGIENKARRGELKAPLPVGLLYDSQNRVILDPDQQVQQTIRTFFRTYRRTGSACATVRYFNKKGLQFPKRLRAGPNKGKLLWGPLIHSQALRLLHNPRYAGAFVYGRSRSIGGGHRRGGCQQRLPLEQWGTVLPESHPGYITWDQFQQNQHRLRQCSQALGSDRRRSPPREGPALLQGLVLCGICGQRMTVRYHTYRQRRIPDYVCQKDGIEHASPICQTIHGGQIDEAIGELILRMVEPVTIDVALAVQHELRSRLDEADRLRWQQVERARYEADLARQRYMQTDPNNRLVADALEADWNERLRELTQAQEHYEQHTRADRDMLDETTKAQVRSLAADFPRIWRDPQTPDRDRKRMTRLLIEDVTLVKAEKIAAHVRFRGGATHTLELPRPLRTWESRQTNPQVVEQIDRLLADHVDSEIVSRLNELGLQSGTGRPFTLRIVGQIRKYYKLKSHYERLRQTGMLTVTEMAKELNVCTSTVRQWQASGLIRARRYNDKNQCLYEPPRDRTPLKMQGVKLSDPRRVCLDPVESHT